MAGVVGGGQTMGRHAGLQVSIRKFGGYNVLSYEQFLALSVSERMALITADRVQFLREGQLISARAWLEAT